MNLAKMFAEWKAKAMAKDNKLETTKIKSKIDKLESTNLGTINGVGESTVKVLLENWISSLAGLEKFWIKEIKKLKLNPFSLKAIKKFLDNGK